MNVARTACREKADQKKSIDAESRSFRRRVHPRHISPLRFVEGAVGDIIDDDTLPSFRVSQIVREEPPLLLVADASRILCG